ncbi:hypothetical protein, partial [Xanthomonas oryzae]|uniref:hypothetical protein n=2 Tax=Xanthomonas oryzae TaxID=347 RepID=UPI001C49EEE2
PELKPPPQNRHFDSRPSACFYWWAQKDSNLQPKDYEFVANVLCLGKSSIGERKLQNKKVSCDSSLAQLDEGGQN